MKINRSPRGYWLFVLFAASFLVFALNFPHAKAQSNSQVRIVRLSFVEGTVRMYRPDADQWAQAFVNTPIQQGFKLATDANSFAEVEFENGSTARLGQSSELDFTRMALSPGGGKINDLTLAQGYATFAFTPERGDVYKVGSAGSTFDVSSKSMFRLDLDQDSQRLEVFNGAVAVQSPYGSESVARNQVLDLAVGGSHPSQISSGITEDAWDQWVDKRQQTATLAINQAGPAQSGLDAGGSLYGWSDLSYFGAWNYLPGMGSCWSPMMGADWVPYSVGRWSWYPGMGYTWISAMPWGWLPFHYGSWIYPAGMGWCWVPGGFSAWSPSLVSWYQGPGWVSWAPRTYSGSFRTPLSCPAGQNCSVAVSSNTFQGGRAISPGDVIRVKPFQGRAVNSPTLPLTRSLRLPGPAAEGSGLVSASRSSGSSLVRVRRTAAAPGRVFAQSSIGGSWSVEPHAPAVFDRQTGRFVNKSGPAINSDVLLHVRTGSHPGNNHGPLTSIPISNLGTHVGANSHSSSLVPSSPLAGNAAGTRAFEKSRAQMSRQERKMMKMQQKMERQQVRREMRMEQQSRMSQQRTQHSSSGRSSGGFGGGQSTSRSSGSMGGETHSSGMGGGMSGGMGGGMRGGGGGGSPHGGGPHH
jgi:Family of unknown function (DUF6600)/FecR protein